MSEDWQLTFRALRDEFLIESRKGHQLRVTLTAFPDRAGFDLWVDVVREHLRRTADQRGAQIRHRLGILCGDEAGCEAFEKLSLLAYRSLPEGLRPPARVFQTGTAGSDPEGQDCALTGWVRYLHSARPDLFTTVSDHLTPGSLVASPDSDPFLISALVIDLTLQRMADNSERTEDASGTPAHLEPRPNNLFRRKGQAWEVRFAGGEEFILLASRGAAYLHLLLSHPTRWFSGPELSCLVSQQQDRFGLGSAGEVLEEEMLAGYRARYEELQEEADEAKRNNDEGTRERCEREMAFFLDEIKRAQGLGGELRQASDDRERVRKAVGNAIRRTVTEISKHDPALAKHLERPRLQCGRNLCYDPPEGMCWETAG
jgi:hypothetical protein